MIAGLSGLLETAPLLIGSMQTRKAQVRCSLSRAFSLHGRAVLLVDSTSQSAAEIFAAVFRKVAAPGRRRDQRGNVIPSAIIKLPTARCCNMDLQSIGLRKERCWKLAG